MPVTPQAGAIARIVNRRGARTRYQPSPGARLLAGIPGPFAAEATSQLACLARLRSLRRCLGGRRAILTVAGSAWLWPAPARNPGPQPGRRLGQPAQRARILDQPDHTVLIAATPVDDAWNILLDIVVKVKIVSDEFHL